VLNLGVAGVVQW